jgi:hypothetical protein
MEMQRRKKKKILLKTIRDSGLYWRTPVKISGVVANVTVYLKYDSRGDDLWSLS